MVKIVFGVRWTGPSNMGTSDSNRGGNHDSSSSVAFLKSQLQSINDIKLTLLLMNIKPNRLNLYNGGKFFFDCMMYMDVHCVFYECS